MPLSPQTTTVLQEGDAPQTISGGVASENDLAREGTIIQPQAPVAGGVASENDLARAGTIQQPQAPVAGTVAHEQDAAVAGTVDQAAGGQTIAGSVAHEQDAAVAGTPSNPILVAGGVAREDDSAIAGVVDGGGVTLMPMMQDGFMRDASDPLQAHGPLIVVTVDNAEPPITESEGFLRDARKYLVIEPASGPGDVEVDGFLRTIEP